MLRSLLPLAAIGLTSIGGVGDLMNYRQFSTSANLELPSGVVRFPSTPSIAIRWLIGSGNTIPCTRVGTIGSTMPSSGGVAQSEAAVLQFRY